MGEDFGTKQYWKSYFANRGDEWKKKESRLIFVAKIRDSFIKYKDEEDDPNSALQIESGIFSSCATEEQYACLIFLLIMYREERVRTKQLRTENKVKIEEAFLKYGTSTISTASKDAQDMEETFFLNAESKDEYKSLVASVLENKEQKPKNPEFRRTLVSQLKNAILKWGAADHKLKSAHDTDQMFFTEADTKEKYFKLVAEFIYKMMEEKSNGKLSGNPESFVEHYKQKFFI